MLAPKKDRTRNQILNAAQLLFLDKNGLDFSFRDISYTAEIAIGTVYNYYKDLDAIYRDMILLQLGAYHECIDEAVKGLEDPIDVMVASCLQTLACAAPGSALGKLCFDEGLSSDDVIDSIKRRFMLDFANAVEKQLLQVDRPDIMLSLAAGGMNAIMKDIYHGALGEKDYIAITLFFFRLLGVDTELMSGYLVKKHQLVSLPPMPLSAITYLPKMG